MQKSVSKASRYRQPLGFAGQISKGRHTHFQTYGAQCADSSVKLGKFVQYATSSASLHYDRATAVCGLVPNIKMIYEYRLTGFNADTRPIEVVWDANALDADGNPMVSFNQYTGEYYAFDTILSTTKSQPYKATLIDKLTGDTIGYINFNRSSSRSTITPETDYSRVIKASEAIEACEGNPVIGRVLGLCIFHNLHASDTQGVGFKKGNTATIMRQGAAFIETDQQCNEGDYVFVSRNDGTLAFDSERNKDGYAYTGFGVLKGNKTAELNIIEIGTDMSWARGQIDWSDAVSVNAYNDGTNNVFQAYSDGKLMWEGTLTSNFALSATGFDVRMDGGNLKFTISDGKARINCALTNQPVILYSSGESYAKITCDENSQTQIIGSGNAYLDIEFNGGTFSLLDKTYSALITLQDRAQAKVTLSNDFTAPKTAPLLEAKGNSYAILVMNDTASATKITSTDSANVDIYLNNNAKIEWFSSNADGTIIHENGIITSGNGTINITARDDSQLNIISDLTGGTLNLALHDNAAVLSQNKGHAVRIKSGGEANCVLSGNASIVVDSLGGVEGVFRCDKGTTTIEMSGDSKITSGETATAYCNNGFFVGSDGNKGDVKLTMSGNAQVNVAKINTNPSDPYSANCGAVGFGGDFTLILQDNAKFNLARDVSEQGKLKASVATHSAASSAVILDSRPAVSNTIYYYEGGGEIYYSGANGTKL